MLTTHSKKISSDADLASRSRPSFDAIRRVLREEVGNIRPRLLLMQALMQIVPTHIGGRVRSHLLRQAGCHIGHGTLFIGAPRMVGGGNISARLTIGQHCCFNIGCLFDLEDTITIGDHVGFGQDVMVLTGSHDIGPEDRRVGGLFVRAVHICDGCWLGARVTILPGVTIGRGAVITAGTVVARDVPPNVVVTGTQRMPIDKWQLFMRNGSHTLPTSTPVN